MYTYERSESSNISLEVFQNINPYISGVYGRIWTILGLLEPGEVGEGGGRVPEGRGGAYLTPPPSILAIYGPILIIFSLLDSGECMDG